MMLHGFGTHHRVLMELHRNAMDLLFLTRVVNQLNTEDISRTPEAARSEGRKEVIEQFEPGVYVTLVQLVDGTKLFKRIRFSKRWFAEQQAEECWKENKDRLRKKYSPLPRVNSIQTEVTAAAQPVAEENNPAT
ncbi:protein BREVIS RADIX-like [Olea europaea var. sylvestris]|uniref:protein BREVIS RADIX-like n=1 Tax=Olea europaea var. sylvestris TaxID=158386 RepID=UPI000C1D2C4C|nr:protein BREVIS RADIX-like [Olea europaea var. sylvestris]